MPAPSQTSIRNRLLSALSPALLPHELLSLMLGVRRSGLTNEIYVLDGTGAIRATQGHLRILDRSRIEKAAGDAYGLPEREYARRMAQPSLAS